MVDNETDQTNREGYVIRFQSGLRLKIKFAEYVKLHRIVTGVTSRSIWDLLATGKGTEELLQRVPEEFEAWVKETSLDLVDRFLVIESQAKAIYYEVKKLESRKEQACHPLISERRDLAGIVFSMLDGKPYEHIIWKMIKPKAEKPFTKEADE